MRTIIRQGERRVLLDTDTDAMLWSGRKNYAGQNSPTRWNDLHVHELRGGSAVFYLAHHTCWQGERDIIEALDLNDAQRFAEEHYDELDVDDDQLKTWGLIDLGAVE